MEEGRGLLGEVDIQRSMPFGEEKCRGHRGLEQAEQEGSFQKCQSPHTRLKLEVMVGQIDFVGHQFRSKRTISCKSIAFVDVQTA